MHPEQRDQLVEQRLSGAWRGERHVGHGVQLLVEDEEHQVALVLGVVEERAEADVCPVGDLAHRRRAVAVAGEQLARRRADALARLELLALAPAYAGRGVDCHATNFQPCGVFAQASRNMSLMLRASPPTSASKSALPLTSATSPSIRTLRSRQRALLYFVLPDFMD